MKLLKVISHASEPALKPGRFFLTTPLKKPKRLDLICYRAVLPTTGRTLQTHRLCGLPGDVLEIKAGVLYINGQETDSALKLKHVNKMSVKDSVSITFDQGQSYVVPPYTDTIYVSLEDSYVKSNKVPCERHILPPGLRDEDIFRVFKKNWNRDHFGPVRIPAGKYFVLGDNRGYSLQDSRYLGFVEQSKVVGTVLWK